MLRSRGFATDSTLRQVLQSERKRGDGRLSARSAVLLIGGVSVFLWALIIETSVYFFR
jgi:hypothetical protein